MIWNFSVFFKSGKSFLGEFRIYGVDNLGIENNIYEGKDLFNNLKFFIFELFRSIFIYFSESKR